MRIGGELRQARIGAGLSIDQVAAALSVSNAQVSRIERALAPGVPFVTLSRFASVVGLDLITKLYPGANPLRDAAQLSLLADFRSPSVAWLGHRGPTPTSRRSTRMGRNRSRARLDIRNGGGNRPDGRAGADPPTAAEAPRRWRGRCAAALQGHAARAALPGRGSRLDQIGVSRAIARGPDSSACGAAARGQRDRGCSSAGSEECTPKGPR